MNNDFQNALDAMPEEVDGTDLAEFVAGLVIAYMPPPDAVRTLLNALSIVGEYNQFITESAEKGENECHCPNCTAKRAALVRH